MSAPDGSLETSQPPNLNEATVPFGFDPFELARLRNEVRLMKFLSEMGARLKGTRDADAALRVIVRSCRDHFEASAACLAVSEPPHDNASLLFSVPQNHIWDLAMFAAATRGEKPPVHPHLMFARIRRRDRGWGLLVLTRSPVEFDKSERQSLVKIGVTVSALLGEFDLARMREVRDRIDRKIMEELRPIDLSYQILDALRSLTRYDHSSAVLMNDSSNSALELVAEQIAWRKRKSTRIAMRFALTPQIQEWLGSDIVYGFTRSASGWSEWDGRPMQALAEMLDYNRSEGEQPESEMLCAPLRGRDGVLGLLKVSACRPNTFGTHEADLLWAFLAQASIALQNAERTESLKAKIAAAERKHLMANLARGVSHDLKNALGAILPTVQQLCAEAEAGTLDVGTISEDLQQVERAVQVCRRIFQGMLSSARREASGAPCGNLRHALDGTLAVLEEGMRRRGITVSQLLCDPLPSLLVPQSDLEQLLLNLFTNARDAMPDGGNLVVNAEALPSALRVSVRDNGCGIPAEHLAHAMELFYTTKADGTGLGLANCRSIVEEARGKISIESTPGRGTCVTFVLPVET